MRRYRRANSWRGRHDDLLVMTMTFGQADSGLRGLYERVRFYFPHGFPSHHSIDFHIRFAPRLVATAAEDV